VYAGKPIIGIAGGIGSGKSFVAGLFAEMGARVVDSDALVRAAYQDPRVKDVLRGWWGDDAFGPGGEINRAAVGRGARTSRKAPRKCRPAARRLSRPDLRRAAGV